MTAQAGNRIPDVNDIPDNDLLGRAIRSVKLRRGSRRPKVPRWTVVMDMFALGSTYSQQLCRRFGMDPDELVND